MRRHGWRLLQVRQPCIMLWRLLTSETQTFRRLRQSEEKKRPQFQREFGMGADYIYIYIYVYILLIGS